MKVQKRCYFFSHWQTFILWKKFMTIKNLIFHLKTIFLHQEFLLFQAGIDGFGPRMLGPRISLFKKYDLYENVIFKWTRWKFTLRQWTSVEKEEKNSFHHNMIATRNMEMLDWQSLSIWRLLRNTQSRTFQECIKIKVHDNVKNMIFSFLLLFFSLLTLTYNKSVLLFQSVEWN